MATAVSTHTGGNGPLSLMSCVRESSPQESIADLENDKNVASKKKFWNPRKWFKRKSNKVSEDVSPSPEIQEATIKEALRSRSTSELSETDEPIRRRSGTPMHPGLSVSHDSIFHSPNSGSELELEEAQSSSSLSIQHHPTQTELRLQTELSERLRLRRGRGDTSEDDEGLPRSPCCNSPTATEGLLEKSTAKSHPSKSHSTCSDGSLLSMGSSEIEEDSFGQQSSRHSSKLSLYDKKPMDQDSEWELGPSSASAPLNHSAAHHRVSVRPKRTHGAPRRKRIQPIAGSALPTTPEVNEDSSMRSLTPETAAKETVTELYSSSISMSKTRTESQLKCSSLPPGLAGPGTENSKLNRSRSSAGSKSQDTFTALGEEDEDKDDKKDQSIFARLFPRRSGKKKKSKQESVSTTTTSSSTTLSYNRQTIESNSFDTTTHSTKFSDKRPYSVDTSLMGKSVPRSGPASRQRVLPIDLPATPEATHRELETSPLPDKSPLSTSPLQVELENHFRQRMASSLSTSPPKFSLPNIETPPHSPKSPHLSSPSQSLWSENTQYVKASSTRYFESNRESRLEENKSKMFGIEEKSKVMLAENTKNKSILGEDTRSRIRVSEESKSKVKIAGLSSLQQRVLQHNEDMADNTFKSLTDFASNDQPNNRLITKSHSFKSHSNDNANLKDNRYTFTSSVMSKSDIVEKKSYMVESKMDNSIFKTASLDSMKNLQIINQFEANLTKSDSNESLESGSSAKTSSTEYLDSLNPSSSITISGPSHTSVVSICTSRDAQIVDSIVKAHTQPLTFNLENDSNFKELHIEEKQSFKEQQISVTKIQVKQVSQNVVPPSLPEFLNIHLNKVDSKPATNVVLTANIISPKLEVDNEVTKPKTVFNFEPTKSEMQEIPMRKFSQDDIEVIDKDINEEIVEIPLKNVLTPSTPNVIITSMTPPTSTRIYKKHSEVTSQLRKSSLVSVTTDSKPKISLRTKSNSLDIVDSLKMSSDQNNLDKSELSKQKMSSATDLQETVSSEGVVLRRKSLVKQKQEDEPELMKVFARRSLKLKDADDIAQQVLVMVEDSKNSEENLDANMNMNKSRDSDKENQLDSPVEQRKKSVSKEEKPKEPLVETKFVETTEVTLRKPINNKFFAYQQRTVSLNVPKANEINMEKVQKNNNSFTDRPKTEISEKVTNKTWITTVKKDADSKEEDKKISRDEVITDISSKSDFINEDFPSIPKNFNQRKAEWEKRAQEALKKSVP